MGELTVRKRLALEIARKIYNNQKELHPLRSLFWECTLRCNLQCKHCGSDCRQSSAVKDMPMNDFLQVVDSLVPHVNPREMNVILTGGEPLVRKDIEKLGLELYKREIPWGVVTNGLLLDRKRLDSLLAAGIHSLTVSLDGFEEEHNWLRGKDESYRKAMDAIKMLVHEREIVWDVVTCINRKNYPHLSEFRDHLYRLGVRNWRVFTIFPVGRAAEHAEFQLSDKEFTGLMEFVKEVRKSKQMKLSYGCEGFLGRYEGEVRDGFYHCSAGVTAASVLADGAISACPSIRSNFHQGNIYKDNFIDVWNQRFGKFRNREWARQGVCADCDFFRYCEGNGMHMRGDNGELLFCHHRRLNSL